MAVSSGKLKKLALYNKASVGTAFFLFAASAGIAIGMSSIGEKADSIINNELAYPKYQILQSEELQNQLDNGEISNEEYDSEMEKVNDKEAFLKQFGSEEQVNRYYSQREKLKPLMIVGLTLLGGAAISCLSVLFTGIAKTNYEEKLKNAKENLLDENTPI